MAPTYIRDDDGPYHPREFSREDVLQIKELLAKAEEAKGMHIFTAQQVETLKTVIKTFDDHLPEILVAIQREQVSKMRAEIWAMRWGIIRWVLAAFLLVVSTIQGWQSVIAPLFRWSGK